jgi:hypothetical protein
MKANQAQMVANMERQIGSLASNMKTDRRNEGKPERGNESGGQCHRR